MKLRIDQERINFRLDFDELVHLLDQKKLQETVQLPNGSLSYKVVCLPAGSAPDFQTTGDSMTLSLAHDVIEGHKSALPSLQGIVCHFPARNGGRIEVSLAVNLKKKLKRSLE